MHDWQEFYGYAGYLDNGDNSTTITFLFNIQVLSALLICAAWGAIIYFDRKHQAEKTKPTYLRKYFNGLFLYW